MYRPRGKRTFTVSSEDCSSKDGCSLCTTMPRSCASKPSCFTLKFTTVVFVDTWGTSHQEIRTSHSWPRLHSIILLLFGVSVWLCISRRSRLRKCTKYYLMETYNAVRLRAHCTTCLKRFEPLLAQGRLFRDAAYKAKQNVKPS